MSEAKPSSALLSEIQGADSSGLKDVTTVVNPAAKHDMAMVTSCSKLYFHTAQPKPKVGRALLSNRTPPTKAKQVIPNTSRN